MGGWLVPGSTSCVVTREFVSLQGQVPTACASEAKEFTSNRHDESRNKRLHPHRVCATGGERKRPHLHSGPLSETTAPSQMLDSRERERGSEKKIRQLLFAYKVSHVARKRPSARYR
jgi:hypothetical protein